MKFRENMMAIPEDQRKKKCVEFDADGEEKKAGDEKGQGRDRKQKE